METRVLNSGTQQMFSDFKTNILNEEVIVVTGNLHPQLKVITGQYEDQAITDIIPDTLPLCNQFNACLKVKNDLVSHAMNHIRLMISGKATFGLKRNKNA